MNRDRVGKGPLYQVGLIRSELTDRSSSPPQAGKDLPVVRIELGEEYEPALQDLYPGQEVLILTWLHLADRSVLRCHPRGDPERPMRGVFSTRSPDRPNPLGLHPVRILSVDGLSLTVHPLEALDGTPVVDIKPVSDMDEEEPAWGPDIAARTGRALRKTGRDAWKSGLLGGRQGNLSLRQPDGSMVVTRSGASLARLGPGDLVRADLFGEQKDFPEEMSTEGLMHAEIYRSLPRAGAVLHTHPPYLLALGLRDSEGMLDLPLFEARALAGELIRLASLEPGSRELSRSVGRAAGEGRAVFLQGHGLVCWGESPEEALAWSEDLESLARIRLLSGV